MFEEEMAKGAVGLSLDTFKTIFKQVFKNSVSDKSVETLFKKVDPNSTNCVKWDDFSTFILMDSVNTTEKPQVLEDATKEFIKHDKTKYHKEIIKRVEFVARENKYVSVTQEGMVSLWSAERKWLQNFNCRDSFVQARCWVTCAVCLNQQSKLAVGCDDGRLYLYELFAIKPRLLTVIGPMDDVATCITYCAKLDDQRDLIVWGDEGGNFHMLTLTKKFFVEYVTEDKPATLSLSSLNRKELMEKYGLSYKMCKIHGDWVNQIAYIPELHSVITCSNDTKKSLTVTSIEHFHERSLHLEKGVKCFEYCRRPAFIITAGSDRIIRIWNPYVLQKAAGAMVGHNCAINSLVLDHEVGNIISIDDLNSVKIWNVRSLKLLQTIQDTSLNRSMAPVTAVYWHGGTKSLVQAQESLRYYEEFKILKPELAVTHANPVVGILYNKTFNLLITACESTIQIFDPWNNDRVFQFVDLHHGSEITSIAFDASERRLITCSRNGEISLWNFNNGQELQRMTTTKMSPVLQATHIIDGTDRFFAGVGADRRVSLFRDNPNNMSTVPARELNGDFMGKFLGHKEDILTIAYCPAKNIFATASVDGDLTIWSMTSGHVKGKMSEPDLNSRSPLERAIEKLCFINSPNSKPTGYIPLITIHGDGILRVWDYENKKMIMSMSFKTRAALKAIHESDDGNYIIIGDAQGEIRILDISSLHTYNGLNGADLAIVEVKSWKAHCEEISAVSFSDVSHVVFTASKDRSVRVWTDDGDFIGILNQEQKWNLNDRETYAKYPVDLTKYWDNDKEEQKRRNRLKEVVIKNFSKGALGIESAVINLMEVELKDIMKTNVVPQHILRERVVARTVADRWLDFTQSKRRKRLFATDISSVMKNEFEYFALRPRDKQGRSKIDLTDCKYFSAFHHLPTFELNAIPSMGKKPTVNVAESRGKANDFVMKTLKAVGQSRKSPATIEK